MEKLVQRNNIFNKWMYEINEKGLHIKQKNYFNTVEFFVDFEQIGIRKLEISRGRNGWLTGSIIGALLTAAIIMVKSFGGDAEANGFILYFSISILCGLIYWLTYSKTIHLVQNGNNNAIEFMYNKPNKEVLDKFFETLIESRKITLTQKYGQINLMLPYEQNHQNILWLFNNDVIEKEEFDKKINDLNSTFNRPFDRKIGFNQTN